MSMICSGGICQSAGPGLITSDAGYMGGLPTTGIDVNGDGIADYAMPGLGNVGLQTPIYGGLPTGYPSTGYPSTGLQGIYVPTPTVNNNAQYWNGTDVIPLPSYEALKNMLNAMKNGGYSGYPGYTGDTTGLTTPWVGTNPYGMPTTMTSGLTQPALGLGQTPLFIGNFTTSPYGGYPTDPYASLGSYPYGTIGLPQTTTTSRPQRKRAIVCFYDYSKVKTTGYSVHKNTYAQEAKRNKEFVTFYAIDTNNSGTSGIKNKKTADETWETANNTSNSSTFVQTCSTGSKPDVTLSPVFQVYNDEGHYKRQVATNKRDTLKAWINDVYSGSYAS